MVLNAGIMIIMPQSLTKLFIVLNFITKETTMELEKADLLKVIGNLPSKLIEFLQANDYKVMVCGGFIRSVITGEEVNDIDIFVTSKDWAKPLAESLFGNDFETTPNAYSKDLNGIYVQIVKKWEFKDLESCLKAFDFTIGAAGIKWDYHTQSWQSVVHERFYRDLAAKRLYYLDPEENNSGSSLLRVLKFIRRGYSIPIKHLSRIIVNLNDKVHNDTTKTKEEVVASLLFEIDPNSLHYNQAYANE